MADSTNIRETIKQRKKSVINQVKKLGEMTTLYKILTKTEERIRNNPWYKAYSINCQLSTYDMVLMAIYTMSEARMRGYFATWKRIINEEKKKQR